MSEPWRSRYKRLSTLSLGDAFFNYEPGSICWLKAKDDFADDVEGIAELPDDCYDHPAVLLWTEGSGAKVTIFLVDNIFQWSSASRRHATNRVVRGQHLPISPSPPHPDSGLLLEIDGEPLRSNSYVKIERVRVCSLRALRPHGARKLTAHSYNLLMRYAPAKPPSADINTVQRQPRLGPRYIEALSPAWGVNTYPSVQDCSLLRSHNYADNRVHVENTSLMYTQPPRHYHMRTELEEPLRQSLLHPPHRSSIVPRRTEYMYGTFTPRDRISHFPIQPSRRPASSTSKDRFQYLKVCAVVVFLGVVGAGLYGLFAMAKALIMMVAQWIHNLLSGLVGALAL